MQLDCKLTREIPLVHSFSYLYSAYRGNCSLCPGPPKAVPEPAAEQLPPQEGLVLLIQNNSFLVGLVFVHGNYTWYLKF